MKKFITINTILLILTASAFTGCNKLKLDEDVPKCIENRIKDIIKAPVTNPPAKVVKWVDGADTYYYFTSDCCDAFNYLYDTDCNVVCAPDGGITGGGDGNCPAFSSGLEKTLIWEDDRN